MSIYFPKSQIKENLYTQGGELRLVSNKQEYSGYYWKYATSRFFTGRSPSDTPSLELEPIVNNTPNFTNPPDNIVVSKLALAGADPDPDNFPLFDEQGNFLIYEDEINKYNNIGNAPLTLSAKSRRMPTPTQNFPNTNDYTRGEFTRYFAKKVNQIAYFEVSPSQYSSLVSKDRKIVWELFIPTSIPWKLTGDKNEVYTVNKRMVELYEQKLELYGFVEYFKNNFTEYYIDNLAT